MRVRIKVCGITRAEDARAAVDLGVDALGFNFVPTSPRRIAPGAARRIIADLPPLVVKVGVFADTPAREIETVVREAGLDVAQLHGDESPEVCALVGVPWFKALRVDDRFRPEEAIRYGRAIVLLDGHRPGALGGTGRAFDWSLARGAAAHGRVILAGGLGPGNIEAAIDAARPFAVDVNSGVESSPGIKDAALLELLCVRVARASALAGGDGGGAATAQGNGAAAEGT
jgi:phosphoribosylanthranilate isomerase